MEPLAPQDSFPELELSVIKKKKKAAILPLKIASNFQSEAMMRIPFSNRQILLFIQSSIHAVLS